MSEPPARLPSDVPPDDRAPTRVSRAEVTVPPYLDAEDTETVLAVLGGARRAGPWTAPELLRVVAVLGGVELDFREAQLPHDVTEVRLFALLGGTTITVPKEIDLEVTAHAVLGGIDQGPEPPEASSSRRDIRAEQSGPGERPLLIVSGVAVMGGITIRVV